MRAGKKVWSYVISYWFFLLKEDWSTGPVVWGLPEEQLCWQTGPSPLSLLRWRDPEPSRISLSPSFHTDMTQNTAKCCLLTWGSPVWAHGFQPVSRQAITKKKKKTSVPQFGYLKRAKAWNRKRYGGRDRWRCLNLLVQVEMRAAQPWGGLFCHAGRGGVEGGRRGDSAGDQGSTAPIIHLPSWQCPVSQGARVTKHNRQASIVALALVCSHV